MKGDAEIIHYRAVNSVYKLCISQVDNSFKFSVL